MDFDEYKDTSVFVFVSVTTRMTSDYYKLYVIRELITKFFFFYTYIILLSHTGTYE